MIPETEKWKSRIDTAIGKGRELFGIYLRSILDYAEQKARDERRPVRDVIIETLDKEYIHVWPTETDIFWWDNVYNLYGVITLKPGLKYQCRYLTAPRLVDRLMKEGGPEAFVYFISHPL